MHLKVRLAGTQVWVLVEPKNTLKVPNEYGKYWRGPTVKIKGMIVEHK